LIMGLGPPETAGEKTMSTMVMVRPP
jgi:hypothetical protein